MKTCARTRRHATFGMSGKQKLRVAVWDFPFNGDLTPFAVLQSHAGLFAGKGSTSRRECRRVCRLTAHVSFRPSIDPGIWMPGEHGSDSLHAIPATQ